MTISFQNGDGQTFLIKNEWTNVKDSKPEPEVWVVASDGTNGVYVKLWVFGEFETTHWNNNKRIIPFSHYPYWTIPIPPEMPRPSQEDWERVARATQGTVSEYIYGVGTGHKRRF